MCKILTMKTPEPCVQRNRIYHGDCLQLMRKIQPQSIDMVMADLPYGTTRNGWDSVLPLDRLWEEYRRIVKPTGVIALTAQAPFSIQLAASNLNALRHEWIWEKPNATGFLNSKIAPLKAHENVLIFAKGKYTYNPQGLKPFNKVMRRGSSGSNYGKNGTTNFQEWTNFPRSVVKFGSDRGLHPTQKPVALFKYLIETYTNPGQLVLDNCMGSGTTVEACIHTGRDYIGMELDKRYFYHAAQRRAAAYGAKMAEAA